MTEKQFENIKYFKPQEFNSPDFPSSWKHMDYKFIRKLDRVREKAGIPINIISAYRTPSHNYTVGGTKTSSHLKGLAIDFKVDNSEQRYKFLKAILSVGFNRIGIGHSFIHIDNDKDKIQGVIWDYYK
jgi:uncharacterized protein YcbK (DUF882 family)